MASAPNPRTPEAIVGRQRPVDPRWILAGAIALSLGLACFAAGRAQAVPSVNEAAAAALDQARVGDAPASTLSGKDPASAGVQESARRDESDPWAMLAAGVFGVGLIARRRTR